MAYITCWLPLLFVIFIWTKSDVASEQCGELSGGTARYSNGTIGKEQPETFSHFKLHVDSILNATIDGRTKTQAAINRIEKLLEKQKQMQTTIDDLKEALKSVNQTVQLMSGQLKDGYLVKEGQFMLQQSDGVIINLKVTIDGLTKTEAANNWTEQEPLEKKKQKETTIDGLTKREEANNRTVQELLEKKKQMQTTSDGLTKPEKSLNQRVQLMSGQLKDACQSLFEAAGSGDANTVKKLYGCTTRSCPAKEGETPLMYAAQYGQVEVVRVLLDCGANVSEVDTREQTALIYAARHGYPDVCSLLLEWGANVNQPNKQKNTPLHFAVWSRNCTVVDLLVERGADVRLKNDELKTAGDVAQSEKYKIDLADCLDKLAEKKER